MFGVVFLASCSATGYSVCRVTPSCFPCCYLCILSEHGMTRHGVSFHGALGVGSTAFEPKDVVRHSRAKLAWVAPFSRPLRATHYLHFILSFWEAKRSMENKHKEHMASKENGQNQTLDHTATGHYFCFYPPIFPDVCVYAPRPQQFSVFFS